MKPFHESLRYEYPLTPRSFVVDVGAYRGHWSAEISRRYGCAIHAYEPVFHKEAKLTLLPFPRVQLHEQGVGARGGFAKFKIKGDMTGEFADGEEREVQLVAVEALFQREEIDLLKLNIEGGEYAVLERMIELGLSRKCKNIQVQFHSNIPDALPRWVFILERLLTTHDVTYMKPFCWENYHLRQ